MAGLSLLLRVWALSILMTGGHTWGRSETSIIGGHKAAPHSRPYMASLQENGFHLCGGVLVHPQWVLTAAHCLTKPAKQLRLVLGLHNLDGPRLTFHIKTAVRHPQYAPAPWLDSDLMLLQLDGKARPSRTVRVLALPRTRQEVQAGARCSVAGWGQTQQGGDLARALQELDVRVLDSRMCNNSRFWSHRLPTHGLCLAAHAKNQAPCKGDSGGPLVCGKGWVDGILSFSSRNCTDVFKPPVATAVAPYVSWIKKVIRRRPSHPPDGCSE